MAPTTSGRRGHACVAGCDAATRAGLLNEIRVRTPSVWAKHGDRLLQVQHACAKKGFCSSFGKQHPDYFAAGVPMGRSIDGELIVSNSVAPLSVATRSVVEKTFGPRLVAMVEQWREMARMASR